MTERDPDFDPNNKKQKLRAHIPGARSSIPEVVKKELSKLGQYCMLTLEPSPIDIAHIIAKTTPKCKVCIQDALVSIQILTIFSSEIYSKQPGTRNSIL